MLKAESFELRVFLMKFGLIQGVYKVLTQYQNFFMKSILNISETGWFYFNQCCLKFLYKIKFCFSNMIFMRFINVLNVLNG